MSIEFSVGEFSSIWRGEGVDVIDEDFMSEIVQAIRDCARRLPVTAKVILCQRAEEHGVGEELVFAPVVIENRRYIYIMYANFTLVFNMGDVEGRIVIPLLEQDIYFDLG